MEGSSEREREGNRERRMEGLCPSKPKDDDDDALELEHSVSDLHALKKLYGLLQQSRPKAPQRDHHQDSLDEKSRHMFKKLLDGATQQVLECQAKIVSCALDPPTPPPIKEPVEETRPELLPDIIQKSTRTTDKLHQYPSIVQCEKHGSSNPLLDAATQQFHQSQAKIVSSALEFPPSAQEKPVCPSPPLKEPGVEPVPESIPNGIRNKIRLWECQSNVQREKQASVDLPIDAATQQFLQCQAKIASSATELPRTSLLQEHVWLSMLKEPGGEHRPEPPHDLIEKHPKPSEKLQDCHSGQHEKLASCSPSVDTATQQCQQCRAKHQMVSSALKPPPLSLEDHCRLSPSKEFGGESRPEHAFKSTEISSALKPPLPSLEDHCQLSPSKEFGGESRPEHAFKSTEKITKSSEKLPEFHSIVQCKTHAACNPSVNVALQQVHQCQAKIVSSALSPPQTSPLEELVQTASLKEPVREHRSEPRDLIEKRPKSSEKLQECHSIVQHGKHASCSQCQTKHRKGSSALEPPSPLLEEQCRSSPLTEYGGGSRPEHSSKLTERSTRSSEKLQECHSVVQCNKHASCDPSMNVAPQQVHQCQARIVTSALEPPLQLSAEPVRPVPLKNPSVDASTQQFLQCQAMIVASAPESPQLPPLEPVRPVPLKEPGEEHRSEPSEPIQKSTRPSEKLRRSHSLVQREKYSSCTPEVRPTAASKQNKDTAGPSVAEQKIEHKAYRDHERTELKRQKSQRSTATDSRIHHAHDPDRPSRTNSGRMQQNPQHPRAHHSSQDPRAHAAPRTITTCGHPLDVDAQAKQKLIRDDSSEPSDNSVSQTLALGRADRQPAQRKPSRLAEEGIAVRRSPARRVTTEKNAMHLHRTESRKSEWSRSSILPDQKVDNELSDDSRLRHKEHAGPSSRSRHIVPEKRQSHQRHASPGLHDRSQRGPSRKGGRRLSPCQSNEGSTGRGVIKSAGSYKALRQSRPVSRPIKPSSSSSSGGSATSASRSSSSASRKWVPPPRGRPERAQSLPRRTPSYPVRATPAHKRSPSPETPKRRRRSPEKPPHRMLTPHLALVPAKSSAAKSATVVDKKGYLPKKSEKLALVPARKTFVSDKTMGNPKKSEDGEGRLKRMKDKLAFIFHHHHHHHHHLHPGGHESKAVSNVGARRHHRSPWEFIGQVLHHSSKNKRQVTEAQHGYLHTLLDAVLRHIWGTRQRRASKAQRKRLEKLATRGRAKGIHWWQWFRKRGGMKAASRKKPRFKMGFKTKGKKS